jgi:hypothetical protein
MVKAHSAHQPIMRFSHGNASHSTTDSNMAPVAHEVAGFFRFRMRYRAAVWQLRSAWPDRCRLSR